MNRLSMIFSSLGSIGIIRADITIQLLHCDTSKLMLLPPVANEMNYQCHFVLDKLDTSNFSIIEEKC